MSDLRERLAKRALENNWVWAYTTHGHVLHFLPECSGLYWWEDKDEDGTRTITYSQCGRTHKFHIPGILSRLGRQRCKQCCRILGIPEGYGTPTNERAQSA